MKKKFRQKIKKNEMEILLKFRKKKNYKTFLYKEN